MIYNWSCLRDGFNFLASNDFTSKLCNIFTLDCLATLTPCLERAYKTMLSERLDISIYGRHKACHLEIFRGELHCSLTDRGLKNQFTNPGEAPVLKFKKCKYRDQYDILDNTIKFISGFENLNYSFKDQFDNYKRHEGFRQFDYRNNPFCLTNRKKKILNECIRTSTGRVLFVANFIVYECHKLKSGYQVKSCDLSSIEMKDIKNRFLNEEVVNSIQRTQGFTKIKEEIIFCLEHISDFKIKHNKNVKKLHCSLRLYLRKLGFVRQFPGSTYKNLFTDYEFAKYISYGEFDKHLVEYKKNAEILRKIRAKGNPSSKRCLNFIRKVKSDENYANFKKEIKAKRVSRPTNTDTQLYLSFTNKKFIEGKAKVESVLREDGNFDYLTMPFEGPKRLDYEEKMYNHYLIWLRAKIYNNFRLNEKKLHLFLIKFYKTREEVRDMCSRKLLNSERRFSKIINFLKFKIYSNSVVIKFEGVAPRENIARLRFKMISSELTSNERFIKLKQRCVIKDNAKHSLTLSRVQGILEAKRHMFKNITIKGIDLSLLTRDEAQLVKDFMVRNNKKLGEINVKKFIRKVLNSEDLELV